MTRALLYGLAALGLLVAGAQLAHYERNHEIERARAAAELAIEAARRTIEHDRATREQLLVEIAAREQAETALSTTLASCRPPPKRGRR